MTAMANQNDADGLLPNDVLEQEIQALQRELGRLKHYTDDIGKARDASDKVMQASERFVAAFQAHIKSLVGAMELSASNFEQTCAQSSDQLHKASLRFDADIDRSQKLLDVLGKQLDATAARVEQMTGEIRQMDIPGRFASVSKEVQSAEAKLLATVQEVRTVQQRLEGKHEELVKQSKTRFIVSVMIGVVTLGLLLFVAFK